jgi:hypothetical protein
LVDQQHGSSFAHRADQCRGPLIGGGDIGEESGGAEEGFGGDEA